MKLKKRIAALLMAGAMVCSALPVNVLAVENSNQNVGGLCEHHTEHNADCGYTEGIEGTPCGFVCGECSVEDDPETATPSNAEQLSAGDVQKLIDTLPDAAELDGMDDAEAMAVYEAFQAACDAYYDTLTEEQQAQLKNTEKLAALSERFSQLAALAEGTHNKHCVCGNSGCNNHQEVTFEIELTVDVLNRQGYSLSNGAYYLSDNLNLTNGIEIRGDVTICLNGHKIERGSYGNKSVFHINSGKTLTLTDCVSTGKVTHFSSFSGCGVDVSGTFNMYGGSITGNWTMIRDGGNNGNGGGVNVYDGGTFNMYGGTITGNTANYGGGVYVWNGGTFNMYGGAKISDNTATGSTITGNTANYGGGGVYVDGGTFTVSGAAKVTDNKKGSALNNVYLPDSKTITIGDALENGASIGVTTASEPTVGDKVQFATGANNAALDYATIFTPDVRNMGYEVTKAGDCLYLSTHQHSWSYTANGATITAKCSKSGCPAPDGGSVTISKPAHTTYGDGQNENATLTETNWQGLAVNQDAITYKKDGTSLDAAPTDADTYTASITLGSATASVTYEIAKATPTPDLPTGLTATYGDTLVDVKLPTGWAWDAPTTSVGDVGNNSFSATYTPTDTSNYNTATATLTVTVKAVQEQFSLTPGGRYYFDLSAMNIPGTVNGSLPDRSLHWVPFTYVGTINAYSRNSEGVSTDGAVSPYNHSLFIADYNVTLKVSWDGLNEKQMIFGTPYTSYGVNYTMRAPSVGSNKTGPAGSSEHGAPQSNEWDKILDKGSDYIKNWSLMYSWGQDTYGSDASKRTVRGYNSARRWGYSNATTNSLIYLGFRPVFELPDTLSSDSLKVVTLNLNGGKLGGSSDAIQIIVKNSSTFTAPVSDGLTRPDGDTGNYFMWLDGNGNSYAPGGSVPADVTELTVQWTAPTYTVTLNTNGGTINSGNVTEYTYGVGATLPTAGDMTYTGHTFKGWYDNKSLTGSPVTAIGGTEMGNKEYWAKWEINQYTITVKPENGKADITITQDYGTPITAPTLTREGYQFNGWNKTFPTTMPAGDMTITAQWTLNRYTISYNLNNGTATGNPDSYTVESDAITLNTPTRPGYTFTGWSGTGLDGENNMTVTIPTGSTGNRTYTAHWRYNGGGSSGYSYYTIKATAGAGGSISPSGNVSVREGRDQIFTITPDKGYAVSNVKIDGKSIGAVKSYTFENVRRTHTIEVIFMKANGNPQTGVFVDVATGSYYEDAVDWAVENGITKGTDDTHFSPDGICTRAQAVTFLWRAAGSPKPETRTMPFADVPVGSYYYDAVLWAVENGITEGTSDTTFSPDATCSRAQIVAFLWRSEKSPAAGTANPFADVKSTAYYADAVLWAVKENITKGTTSTTFSPDADCTRAQIVTFLWRCKK